MILFESNIFICWHKIDEMIELREMWILVWFKEDFAADKHMLMQTIVASLNHKLTFVFGCCLTS